VALAASCTHSVPKTVVLLIMTKDGQVQERPITFKDKDRLDKYLDRNNYKGLELADDAPLVAPGSGPTLACEPLFDFDDLAPGAKYWPVPKADPVIERIVNLEGCRRNLNNCHEQEMGQALARASEVEYGMPPGSACEVRDLRVVKDERGQCKFEFDSVVVQALPGGQCQYWVAEHKMTTKGTGDVDDFLKKVKQAEAYLKSGPPHVFTGRPLKLAFMSEYMSVEVENKVTDVCGKKQILRLKRGSGGIVRASLRAHAVATPSRLRGAGLAKCNVRIFC